MKLPHLIQEAAIDLVDYFQRARQHAAEQRQPPGLQRLGQQRVVGVGQRAPGDVPGLVPLQPVLVHQQPHQFGHRDRRMGVVQLRGEQVREAGERLALDVEQAQHVLQRAGDEEVLLRQPQALADLRLVVRIEHLAQGLRDHLLAHRTVIVADVEVLEIEGLDRLALPQPQGIAGIDPVAEHRRVAGHALDPARRNPAHPIAPSFVDAGLAVAAEIHVVAHLRTHDLPGVALLQPLVGHLHLPTVADLLVEDAELVADAVADGRDLQRRQRIHVAGRQPSEAAVAQPRLLLQRADRVEIPAQRAHCLARGRLYAEGDQVVAELRSDQEFGRQVARNFQVARRVGLHRAHPARQHPVAHRVGERHVPVVGRGDSRVASLQAGEIVQHRALQRLGSQPAACRLDIRSLPGGRSFGDHGCILLGE